MMAINLKKKIVNLIQNDISVYSVFLNNPKIIANISMIIDFVLKILKNHGGGKGQQFKFVG